MCSLTGAKAFSPVVAREVQLPPESGSFRVTASQRKDFGLGKAVYELAECVQRARQWQRSAGIEAVAAETLQHMLGMERSNRG